MKPTVLFSPQAPTLLRRFADTNAWRVLPHFSPHNPKPDVCVVHDMSWYDKARSIYPGVPLAWFFHSGRIGWNDNGEKPVPEEHVEHILVCADHLATIWQARYPKARVHVITPWYRPMSVWSWCKDRLFSMLNNPNTCYRDREELTKLAVYKAGKERVWAMFGEGQPTGPLGGSDRRDWEQRCSAYVDVVPSWAGFGLSHHEMYTAGVPVASVAWGRGPRDVHGTGANTSRCADIQACAQVIQRLCEDESFALQSSDCGLTYIAERCNLTRMNIGISAFLDRVRS